MKVSELLSKLKGEWMEKSKQKEESKEQRDAAVKNALNL